MGLPRRPAALAERTTSLVSLDEASREPYSTVLSYPHANVDAVISRISQLKALGVEGLEFSGRLKIGKLSVLGKGVAGVVLGGMIGGRMVALKIRREDSRRDSLTKEGAMLQLANNVDVGPKFVGVTRDILAMELVRGNVLPVWLEKTRGRGQRSRVRSTFTDALHQCFRLDSAYVDHGELSRAHKNILVRETGKPCILDFESAGRSRRASNFTSLVQYLFLGGGFSKKVARILGPVERERLLGNLRLYKTTDRTGGFDRALDTLRLGGSRGGRGALLSG